MPKTTLKSIDIDLISGHFCGLIHQYLAKFSAQFNIDNEEKIWWFEKTAIFVDGHLKRPAILATLTVFFMLSRKWLLSSLLNMLDRIYSFLINLIFHVSDTGYMFCSKPTKWYKCTTSQVALLGSPRDITQSTRLTKGQNWSPYCFVDNYKW